MREDIPQETPEVISDNSSSGACVVHHIPLVPWYLRGKGNPPTLVCTTCETGRQQRLKDHLARGR